MNPAIPLIAGGVFACLGAMLWVFFKAPVQDAAVPDDQREARRITPVAGSGFQ